MLRITLANIGLNQNIKFKITFKIYIIINILYYLLDVGLLQKYRYIVGRNAGICHDKNTSTFKKHIGTNILSPSDKFFHQVSILYLHPVR